MKNKGIHQKLLSTIGMTSTNLLKLNRMKEEIEDLNNPFTNTPFYLTPILYQKNMGSPCDVTLKQDALKLCEFAVEHLTKINESSVKLLEDSKSEENRISMEEITERFGVIVSDKETKRAIVLFLKDYSLNKQFYNNKYNKKELDN